jgi:hypothetical protein
VAAWVAGLALLTTWSNTTAAEVTAAGATFLAGLLLGRWWVLLVPITPGVLFALTLLLSSPDPDAYEDFTGLVPALFILLATFLIALPLAIGVAVNKLGSRYLRPRRRRLREHAA